MLVEFLIILVSGWLSLYLYVTRNFNHWKAKHVDFLKPLPFIGNMFNCLILRQSAGEVLRDIYRKSVEPFVGFFILDQPCLLIRDPQIIKTVLINDFHLFNDRNAIDNKEGDPISAYTLFLLKNPDWKEIRTKVNPAFTPAKIKVMSRLVEDSTRNMIEYINNEIKETNEIELKALCAKFTVDAITSCAFGVEAHSFTDSDSQFWGVAKKMTNWSDLRVSLPMRCYFFAPTIVKLFGLKFLRSEYTTFLKDVFLKIIDERRASKVVRNDLIDIIIRLEDDENFKLEDDKLVSQAIQFFVAGYETTSAAITFVLYELAKEPHIQEVLRTEIRSIAEKHGGITYEAIREMPYLEMCIKETLRKYPTVPFLDRQCNRNYKIPGTNVIIDKGTAVMISLMGLHYDPKYYPDPDKFDPERFSKENNEVKSFTYLPFGEGPRSCIGERFALLNSKFGVANLVYNFQVQRTESTPDQIRIDPRGISLNPEGSLKLKFIKI